MSLLGSRSIILRQQAVIPRLGTILKSYLLVCTTGTFECTSILGAVNTSTNVHTSSRCTFGPHTMCSYDVCCSLASLARLIAHQQQMPPQQQNPASRPWPSWPPCLATRIRLQRRTASMLKPSQRARCRNRMCISHLGRRSGIGCDAAKDGDCEYLRGLRLLIVLD